MKYVTRSTEGIMVLDKKTTYLTKGIKQFINELCIKNLSTFEGREQAASIILQIKCNLPIYVDEELILFPTKSLRNANCIYVNFHKVLTVKEIDNGFTKVIFSDLTEVKLDVNISKIERQLSRANTLYEYKTLT